MQLMGKMVLVALFWAGVYPVGHSIMVEMHPIVLAFYRYLLTTILLFPILWWKERAAWRIQRGEWLLLFLIGFLGVFIYNSLFFTGLKWSGVIKSSVIIASIPIFTTILAAIVFKERLTSRQVAGILLSFSGVVLVVTNGQLTALLSISAGDGWLLVAVLVWAIYTLLSKQVMLKTSPLKVTTYSAFFGTLLLAPASLLTGTLAIGTLTLGQWSAIAYMAVFASVLAFIWFNQSILHLGPGLTSIFINLVPVFALLLSVFTGEKIFLTHIVGMLLVLAGVCLTTLQGIPLRKPKQASHLKN